MQQETNKIEQPATLPQKRSTYVSTIRDGAIAANVFCGQSQDGREYHYFSLSRSWKNSQNEQGYSSKFFGRNAEALVQVIQDAAKRCSEMDQAKEG